MLPFSYHLLKLLLAPKFLCNRLKYPIRDFEIKLWEILISNCYNYPTGGFDIKLLQLSYWIFLYQIANIILLDILISNC